MRSFQSAGAAGRSRVAATSRRTIPSVCITLALMAASSAHAVLVNPGFEQGQDLNLIGDPDYYGDLPKAFPGWTLTHYYYPGIGANHPTSIADINLQTQGGTGIDYEAEIFSASPVGSQPDYYLVGATPTPTFMWPLMGNKVALLNQYTGTSNPVPGATNIASLAMELSQVETLTQDDVDPIDGFAHIRFSIGRVEQNPLHTANQSPWAGVEIYNVTQGKTVYFSYVSGSETLYPYQYLNTAGDNVGSASNFVYLPWISVDVAPGPPFMNIGDTVEVKIYGAGCSPGGHKGLLYVDSSRRTPGSGGLAITATQVGAVTMSGPITYSYSYSNNSAAGANAPIPAGAAISINPPQDSNFENGTTTLAFQSMTVGPSLTCTPPAVGGKTTVDCTVNSAIPDATIITNALQVTYAVPATVSQAPGTIVTPIHMTNYTIASPGLQTLLGPDVQSLLASVDQAITFANPGTQQPGTTRTLVATSSSGMPVTFTSATPAVCSVTPAGVVKAVGPGTCTINANQPGGNVFLAAPQVTQSFAVPGEVVPAPTLGDWMKLLLAALVCGVGLAVPYSIRKTR